MLHRGFDTNKFTVKCKLCLCRIKILRNQKRVAVQRIGREVTDLLKAQRVDNARIRVESVIHENNLLRAYDILEVYLELVSVRAELLTRSKEMPSDMMEALGSIAFAGARMSNELDELRDIYRMLADKYDKVYKGWSVAAASEGSYRDWRVNETLVSCLAIQAPRRSYKESVLEALAAENGVEYTAQPEPADGILPGGAVQGGTQRLAQGAPPQQQQQQQQQQPPPPPPSSSSSAPPPPPPPASQGGGGGGYGAAAASSAPSPAPYSAASSQAPVIGVPVSPGGYPAAPVGTPAPYGAAAAQPYSSPNQSVYSPGAAAAGAGAGAGAAPTAADYAALVGASLPAVPGGAPGSGSPPRGGGGGGLSSGSPAAPATGNPFAPAAGYPATVPASPAPYLPRSPSPARAGSRGPGPYRTVEDAEAAARRYDESAQRAKETAEYLRAKGQGAGYPGGSASPGGGGGYPGGSASPGGGGGYPGGSASPGGGGGYAAPRSLTKTDSEIRRRYDQAPGCPTKPSASASASAAPDQGRGWAATRPDSAAPSVKGADVGATAPWGLPSAPETAAADEAAAAEAGIEDAAAVAAAGQLPEWSDPKYQTQEQLAQRLKQLKMNKGTSI